MIDYLTYFVSLLSSSENQLVIMFLSAFLSSTLLPGNSEVIFSALVTQTLFNSSQSVWLLLLCATIGNSVGSLTTYWVAYLVPEPQLNEKQSKTAQWALHNSRKYGVWILLLSWLPVIGDLLCGIAGWLRFNIWQTILCIAIGKLARYAVLLWGIWAIIG
ncbi:hypothetical protein BMT54_04935 [Pasteurellaceae bacterium 15-036681]|nr:hypothetical protein BMT54_04935 [Pasteurellaceae bacterium 15-036681]